MPVFDGSLEGPSLPPLSPELRRIQTMTSDELLAERRELYRLPEIDRQEQLEGEESQARYGPLLEPRPHDYGWSMDDYELHMS